MKISTLILYILVPLVISLLVIWSLNTLFLLDIEYTVETWLAMFLLLEVLKGDFTQ